MLRVKMPSIAQIGAGLIGAAFGVKVFDDKKAWWARAAYGVVAFDLIRTAMNPEGHLFGQQPGKPRLGYAKGEPDSAKTPLKFQERRVRTIDERVAYVHQQMIQGTRDPKIYALAREVLTKKCGDGWCVDEKDHKAEVTALFNEVRKRVRYTWDPTDYDAFQTPAKTLALAAGDCDDYVSLLGALCRSVGHKVRSRIVQTQGSDTWNHIYLAVQVNGQWMPCDPSVKQPAGWEVPSNLVVRKQDYDVVEKGNIAPLDK